jgi:hypothetical protein
MTQNAISLEHGSWVNEIREKCRISCKFYICYEFYSLSRITLMSYAKFNENLFRAEGPPVFRVTRVWVTTIKMLLLI